MPKVRKTANKARAKKLTEAYIKNDLNGKKTAEELGVEPAAVYDHLAKNPIVRNYLREYQEKLEKSGVDDELSIKVIRDGMKAGREILVDGKPLEGVEIPDHGIRLKANEQYLKIKKILSTDTPQVTPNDGGQHIHIHLEKYKDMPNGDLIAGILEQASEIRNRKP